MAAIWDSRNKWSHDDQGFNPTTSVDYVAETLAIVHGLSEKSKVRRPACTWHGPPVGIVKINSDGAIREGEGVAASGGIARDADGFRSAWCKVYRGISDPLIIEALALRDAVAAARQQNLDNVIAETLLRVGSLSYLKQNLHYGWRDGVTDR
ncbi:unnamed protein product [Alopecurus aequalis]